MSKRDIVLTNVTVVQLLRPPCTGEGGGGATPGREERAVGPSSCWPGGAPVVSTRTQERRRGVRHHLPVGALPSRAAALPPRSPTLLTTWFVGKVRSMMMVEGKGSPAPRLGFAPIASWKGRNPTWAETETRSTRGHPGSSLSFPPRPLTDRGLGGRQPPHLRGGRGRGGRGSRVLEILECACSPGTPLPAYHWLSDLSRFPLGKVGVQRIPHRIQ